eukprot:GILK01010235.1.p1 GENE.GILK01010235.1~~GILK01010235.1.p1  ORF type:complete len:428 (-),score=43.03 GILK01010235.1:147-1430(-)
MMRATKKNDVKSNFWALEHFGINRYGWKTSPLIQNPVRTRSRQQKRQSEQSLHERLSLHKSDLEAFRRTVPRPRKLDPLSRSAMSLDQLPRLSQMALDPDARAEARTRANGFVLMKEQSVPSPYTSKQQRRMMRSPSAPLFDGDVITELSDESVLDMDLQYMDSEGMDKISAEHMMQFMQQNQSHPLLHSRSLSGIVYERTLKNPHLTKVSDLLTCQRMNVAPAASISLGVGRQGKRRGHLSSEQITHQENDKRLKLRKSRPSSVSSNSTSNVSCNLPATPSSISNRRRLMDARRVTATPPWQASLFEKQNQKTASGSTGEVVSDTEMQSDMRKPKAEDVSLSSSNDVIAPCSVESKSSSIDGCSSAPVLDSSAAFEAPNPDSSITTNNMFSSSSSSSLSFFLSALLPSIFGRPSVSLDIFRYCFSG